MALTLQVATYQNLPPSRPMSKEFGPNGGSIGRAPNNDLVLPDPLQFVSRTQARIQHRDGAYFIVDEGRNPVHLNDKPLGAGREARLSDNDRISIGDYSLLVHLEPEMGRRADEFSQPRASGGGGGSLLGDDLDPIFSIRPIGDKVHAFGIDLGGGTLGGLTDGSESAVDRSDPLLPSGTQRDQLDDVNQPWVAARPSRETPRTVGRESSLLDGLDGESGAGPIPPSSHQARTSGSMSSNASSSPGPSRIPEDFDPLSQSGIRRPSVAVTPSSGASTSGGDSSGSSIPDDFDPFSSPSSSRDGLDPARPAPSSLQDRPPEVRAPASRVAREQPSAGGPIASSKAEAGSARAAVAREDFSLLEGLDGGSSAAPPTTAAPTPPSQTANGDARAPSREQSRGKPAGPFVQPGPVDVAGRTQSPSASAMSGGSAEQLMMAGYVRALTELLDGAEVPELTERVRDTAQPMRRVGELLRMMVVGLQRVLHARALTKQEMRVDMTIVHQRKNNPLKFSGDASEALMHLLAPREGGSYLPPDQAVIESFEDVQAHHLAVMAGVRAALQGVLRRFDPHHLERRLQSHPLLDKVLPMNRKAKMWDLLMDLHSEIERESEDDFDRLFGQHFRKAYEEQVRELRGARKKDSSKPS